MSKFLITGITGFAGSNLAKLLLKEGHEVHGVVRCSNGRDADLLDILTKQEHEAIEFHYLDLKDYFGVEQVIAQNNFDGVYHLAAQSHPPTSFNQTIMTFADNVTATVNIIEALKGQRTKLLCCSTSEVYGDTCDGTPLKTDRALTPSNPYAVSKASMDLYMQERMTNGFINGFITRAFSHTGIRRGYNFSISSDAFQIAKMKLGLQKKVLKIGNLKTKRVVMDVRDCVNAYYLLMMNEGSNGNIYNVCGSEVREMQYFADTLIEISGLEGVTQEIEPKFYRDIDIQIQIGDSTDLVELTGWTEEYEIKETLTDLLDYWVRKLSS